MNPVLLFMLGFTIGALVDRAVMAWPAFRAWWWMRPIRKLKAVAERQLGREPR